MLGPVELVGASGEAISISGSKMRRLVAILALEAGSTVSQQRIVDALWGEQGVNGPNVVHVAVSKLRRLLVTAAETDPLATQPAGYQLQINPEAVDALRFEALVDQARKVSDDPARVAELLKHAPELWRGAPLAGVPDTELIGAMRTRRRSCDGLPSRTWSTQSWPSVGIVDSLQSLRHTSQRSL